MTNLIICIFVWRNQETISEQTWSTNIVFPIPTFRLTLRVIYFRYKTPVTKFTAIKMTSFSLHFPVSIHHTESIHIRRYTDHYFIWQLWLQLLAVTTSSVWAVGWVDCANRINEPKEGCNSQLSDKVMTTCNEVRPSFLSTRNLSW